MTRGFGCFWGERWERWNATTRGVKAFNEAIRLNSAIPDSYHELGVLLSKLNRDEEAIKALTQAVKLKEDNFALLYDLGRAQFKAGWTPEAIESLVRATSLKSDFAPAF